jgi:hypothetical protein
MSKEIIFDARELEAPLPLQRGLFYAKGVKDDEYIKMIHRMRPCHLFDMLEKLGVWSGDFEHGDDHLIFMAKSPDAILFVKELIKNEYGRTVA